ncbi:putative lipid II flippase MurJ [Anaplasma platys]|uniref:Probable lipid II flippase MurJ n=1 Tax=Anaplasma platys TaxID=949 RepID=A0A858PZI4_9RICK|nr:murein biosynthesis integral membrane protein MurJ [Anaplasma platys]QJC27970.1 putative lipid II flippase MurJ [Anaplasma platys]
MLGKIFTFSFVTLLSRILGLARDMLIAYTLGAQGLSDVFLAAFRLPALFRTYFSEGVLSMSFVPIYSKKLQDTQEAQRFADQVFTGLLVFLLLLCFLLFVFTPKFLSVFAPGFLGSTYKFGLTVELVRIMLPYMLFVAITSVIGGILQTHQCFYITALVPVILNVCMIVSALCPHWSLPVYNFSVGVSCAGVIQFGMALYAVKRRNISVKLVRPRVDEEMRVFLKRSGMSLLSGCASQLSVWVNTIFASAIPGAITYFYYSDRVNQLPQSLVGISMSVVLMPTIAKLARGDDTRKMIEKQNQALDLGLTLIVPSAAVLIAMAEPVLLALLHYGQFDYWAVGNTAPILSVLATTLPAYVVCKILLMFFYARGEFGIPAIFAVASLCASGAVSYVMMRFWGSVGIAVGSAVGTWLNAIFLMIYLRARNLYEFSDVLINKLSFVFLSATIMVVVLGMCSAILAPYLFQGALIKIVVIVLLLAVGVAVYLFTLCGIFRQQISVGDI